MQIKPLTIRQFLAGQNEEVISFLEQWREAVMSNQPFYRWHTVSDEQRILLNNLALQYITYLNDLADEHEYQGNHSTDNQAHCFGD